MAEPAPAPTALRCEYHVNPLGIDVLRPTLSWQLQSDRRGTRQAAYRVLVAAGAEGLQADYGELWDSGRVESDWSIHVEYEGLPLEAHQECHWKVRVWDDGGVASVWRRPARS